MELITVEITARIVRPHARSCRWLAGDWPGGRPSPWREAGVVELTADGRQLWEVPRRQPKLAGTGNGDELAVRVLGWEWWTFRCGWTARARRPCQGEIVVRADAITDAFAGLGT